MQNKKNEQPEQPGVIPSLPYPDKPDNLALPNVLCVDCEKKEPTPAELAAHEASELRLSGSLLEGSHAPVDVCKLCGSPEFLKITKTCIECNSKAGPTAKQIHYRKKYWEEKKREPARRYVCEHCSIGEGYFNTKCPNCSQRIKSRAIYVVDAAEVFLKYRFQE